MTRHSDVPVWTAQQQTAIDIEARMSTWRPLPARARRRS